MTKISTINPQDAVLDTIHAAQEKNYQKIKNFSPQQVVDYYNKSSQQITQKDGYSLTWDKKIGYGKIKEAVG